MKNLVIILVCLLVSGIALGQNQKVEEMQNVLKKSEVQVTPPQFTGIEDFNKMKTDENSIANYLAAHFNYFEKNEIVHEGTVVAQFNITNLGEVADIEITNSISPQIDREIIRVIQTTNGMWKPGFNDEDAVTMQKEVALEIQALDADGIPLNRDFAKKAQYYFAKGSKNLIVKNNFKRALKNYDNGIRYKPYDESLYFMRGLCRYELGYIEGARQDWQRITDNGSIYLIEVLANYDIKKLEGYEEFMATIIQAEQ